MATGLDELFNFCVVDVHGEVRSYRMRPSDLMSKVINAYCQARDLDQDPQFFYYWNERILPTERADQIGLGAGGEIWHIFMLDFFKRDNLTTVVEDGLVPFEHVQVRDSHKSYFFHAHNLYEMDHLEVQEEELLLEVEVIRHSSFAL
jgi:hypothetical protein